MRHSGVPLYPILVLVFSISLHGMSCSSRNAIPVKPEDNRFTKVVLATNLDEPMQFEILNDGRVLFAERKGKIKVYDPATEDVKVIADIPVSIGYYSKSGREISPTGEDGMQGVLLDPGFEQNHRIYLFYTPKEGETSVLARFVWEGDSIKMNSRKVLLEVPNQREMCCHLGGGMVFDSHGNLFLSTGDNTSNGPGGFPHLDERPDMSNHDSQRSSANTNDLRGKILRIHPEDDGSYTIPEGNLFAPGTPKTRPEIYTMGNRNPYRLNIDSKTGFLYWGEVGPGGIVDSVGRGPKSYDEFNQARKAGNFGWPYAAGNNQAYWDYDFATRISGERFDTAHPVNRSPNNTGLAELPPSQPAFIWYPQTFSPEFPLLGTGSASAMGGPVYRRADFKNPKRPFPSYYEGKWFITDWTRGWIMLVTMDENHNYKSMERFMPELQIEGPNDMEFGPDGDLYVLQYGRGPYVLNREAELFKIEYHSGNRKPQIRVSSDKKAGALPLLVNLSSKGTIDYDNDVLNYEWKIISNGQTIQQFDEADPSLILTRPGRYQAQLIVKDSKGSGDSASIEIVAGNEPPVINIDIKGHNSTFFFPDSVLNYAIDVTDKEDGSIADKKISSSQVTFNIDYLSEGLDPITLSMTETGGNEGIPVPFAVQLINRNDCKTCHIIDAKSIGPSFMQVADRYTDDDASISYLVKKIKAGGSGVWGNMTMPPHLNMSDNDAAKIAGYILKLRNNNTEKSFPLYGKYITAIPAGERGFTGSFIFRAVYTDKGTTTAPAQTTVATIELRNQVIPAIALDILHETDISPEITKSQSSIIPKGPGSYAGIRKIDLTGIKQIEIAATALQSESSESAGIIEIRIDSPSGEVIGNTTEIKPPAGPENFYGKSVSRVNALIKEVKGVHDIYFVVKKSAVSQNRMRIRNIKFNHIQMNGN